MANLAFLSPIAFSSGRRGAFSRVSTCPSPPPSRSAASFNTMNRGIACSVQASTAHDNLVTWCESNGIEMAKISIGQSHESRCLIAEIDIERDDVLLSIPAQAIMAVSSDKNCDPPEFSRLRFQDTYFWEEAPWDIRLGVLLLDHYLANHHSIWYPYINSLPARPDSAICALAHPQRAPEARTQLQALDLLDTADSYAAYVVGQYNSFSSALSDGQDNGDGDKVVDMKLFCWAAAIALSRAFAVPTLHSEAFDAVPSMPQYFALFPALDCGNHSAHARSELRFDEHAQSYVVIAGKSYAKDRQVYLNYGDRTPAELAIFYGFVEGFSPNASIQVGSEIVWESQDDNDALLKRKVELLEQLDLAHDDDSFRISLHEVDPRLMRALRICTANEEELGTFYNVEEEFKPVGLDNEIRAWKALTTHCEWLIEKINPEFEEEFEKVSKVSGGDDYIPFSVAFDWGGDNNFRADALFRFERNRVLKQTIKRTQQFATMSKKLGRLIDPGMLKGAATTILRTNRPRTFLNNNYFRTSGVKL